MGDLVPLTLMRSVGLPARGGDPHPVAGFFDGGEMLFYFLCGSGLLIGGGVIGFILGQASLAGMALSADAHQFDTGRALDPRTGKWYRLTPE